MAAITSAPAKNAPLALLRELQRSRGVVERVLDEGDSAEASLQRGAFFAVDCSLMCGLCGAQGRLLTAPVCVLLPWWASG